MRQKICHDNSCPPYDSYCTYCSRSSGCDSEDFREVPGGSPESIHFDEIKRQQDIANNAIGFAMYCKNEGEGLLPDERLYELYLKSK